VSMPVPVIAAPAATLEVVALRTPVRPEVAEALVVAPASPPAASVPPVDMPGMQVVVVQVMNEQPQAILVCLLVVTIVVVVGMH
jgi:hypothetical protein